MMTLSDKLTAYGADVENALTRFAGDEELFEQCFHILLEDPNFKALGTFIENGAYEDAFKCAHALKGVIGNMGLTPLYRAVSDLTEALRSERHPDLDEQYRLLMKEYETLQAL